MLWFIARWIMIGLPKFEFCVSGLIDLHDDNSIFVTTIRVGPVTPHTSDPEEQSTISFNLAALTFYTSVVDLFVFKFSALFTVTSFSFIYLVRCSGVTSVWSNFLLNVNFWILWSIFLQAKCPTDSIKTLQENSTRFCCTTFTECKDVSCCYQCFVLRVSACLSVGHSRVPYKNGWTDRDAIWVLGSEGGGQGAMYYMGPNPAR